MAGAISLEEIKNETVDLVSVLFISLADLLNLFLHGFEDFLDGI